AFDDALAEPGFRHRERRRHLTAAGGWRGRLSCAQVGALYAAADGGELAVPALRDAVANRTRAAAAGRGRHGDDGAADRRRARARPPGISTDHGDGDAARPGS